MPLSFRSMTAFLAGFGLIVAAAGVAEEPATPSSGIQLDGSASRPAYNEEEPTVRQWDQRPTPAQQLENGIVRGLDQYQSVWRDTLYARVFNRIGPGWGRISSCVEAADDRARRIAATVKNMQSNGQLQDCTVTVGSRSAYDAGFGSLHTFTVVELRGPDGRVIRTLEVDNYLGPLIIRNHPPVDWNGEGIHRVENVGRPSRDSTGGDPREIIVDTTRTTAQDTARDVSRPPTPPVGGGGGGGGPLPGVGGGCGGPCGR